ncbi:MAG: M48 family metalloprotease [Alphaproteobacteria bacterium]|nr:M48 family metalloprotease [Alphaproteobacteria bacterium]MCB9928693.1 M48 family metalloprotease [Alphaproteobacteria bacterium]
MTRPKTGARWRLLALAGALVALPWLQGCTTNPATGRDNLTFVSQDEERRLGAEAHPKILQQFGGPYDDPKLQAYVNGIGQLLASSSELPKEKWTFTVLDSDIINAFALPGGYIYISRGLVALADDEAQLASVIGHEIGHDTARHFANRQTQAIGAQIGVAVLSVLTAATVGGDAAGMVGQLGGTAAQGYLASYSRGQELESDSLGIRYMARTGYDTAASAEFLGKLETSKALLARLKDEAPRGYSYLDTHPPSAERVREATAQIHRPPPPGAGRDRNLFLQKLDGMIYGDSPAQGFRKGRVFAHPRLRLRFEVPEGFYLLNFPDKVVGDGPDDAYVIFDHDAKRWSGDMPSYLTRQWGAKVRLRDVEAIRVNGRSAATGWTRGTSNGRQVDLRLVAVRWNDGQIYRFRFLAPTQVMARYNRGFRETTYSLRSLSAAEAARLKPDRIRIHTVRRGETFEGLARQTPFTRLAAEHLRVLNGYAPGQQPQAGVRIKLVVPGRR